MSFTNEALKLQNIKLQLNNLNMQFDSFLSQLQNNSIPNIGTQIEDISLKLFNMGLEMLNIGLQSNHSLIFNSAQQIKNIGDMINNVAKQMINMNSTKMDNFYSKMLLLYNNNDNNTNTNNNINPNIIPQITVSIQSSSEPGYVKLAFNYGIAMKEVLKKYFCEKGIPQSEESKYFFIYNAIRIKPDDTTPIEIFFNYYKNPRVLALYSGDIIG